MNATKQELLEKQRSDGSTMLHSKVYITIQLNDLVIFFSAGQKTNENLDLNFMYFYLSILRNNDMEAYQITTQFMYLMYMLG